MINSGLIDLKIRITKNAIYLMQVLTDILNKEVLRRAFISTPNNAEYSLAFQVAKFINSRTKVLFNRNNIHNNFVKDDYGNNTLLINYSYITSKENNLPKKLKGE